MGLDMFFSRREKSENVGYLRKENAIHGWLVENIQDGEDNCGEYLLEEYAIEELIDTIKSVLEDKKLAPKLLPTTQGFFFGNYEYGEWYFEGLEETLTILENILITTDFENEEIYYRAWW